MNERCMGARQAFGGGRACSTTSCMMAIGDVIERQYCSTRSTGRLCRPCDALLELLSAQDKRYLWGRRVPNATLGYEAAMERPRFIYNVR